VRDLLDMVRKGNGDRGRAASDDLPAQGYSADPVRPWVLVGTRVLLWGAVAVGAAGGVVGCLGKTRVPPAPVVETSADPALVPPQVTATAEHIVERWLTATTDDEEQIAVLFVEPPDLPATLAGRYVVDVRSVASSVAGDRYWSVTVAVEMEQSDETEATEPTGDADGSTSADPGADEQVSGPFTWYVEIGIVGDPRRGLKAHRTPALMPPPSPPADDRASTSSPWRPAEQDDELVQTIDGFLDALLAGQGDPDRYFVEELDIRAVDPAPLEDVRVVEVAEEETDGGVTRAQVRVEGVLAGGTEQSLAYEFDLRWSGQEYEILRHWGSATLGG
jgi:hypothetical protein